ncbi:MAG: J domain-containing protein [Nitriliruptoraceae bacterium]
MPDELTTREACDVLGLLPPVDSDDVRRAYREQARRHHPDLGGDARTFQLLQLAYETLLAEPPVTVEVSRGRPSRAAPPRPAPAAQSVDVEVPRAGSRLTVDAVAACVAHTGGLTAASRAPGSLLNVVAQHLAHDVAARLRIGPSRDDRGHPVLLVEVIARTRRSRRALEAARIGDGWVRLRGSSSTTVRRLLDTGSGPGPDARHAAECARDLLDATSWPLSTWRLLDVGQQPAGGAS